MKRIALYIASIVAVLMLVAPATGAPKGKGLESFPVICDGQEVIVTVSGGTSFWIGDQHYLVTSFTFTPEGGTPQTVTFGKKKGLAGSEITCEATEQDESGRPVHILVTAVAVPPSK